jgi:hypothetical protein
MPEKETNYRNVHRSPSDNNEHVSVIRNDGTVGAHSYPDGSFKQFTPKDKK